MKHHMHSSEILIDFLQNYQGLRNAVHLRRHGTHDYCIQLLGDIVVYVLKHASTNFTQESQFISDWENLHITFVSPEAMKKILTSILSGMAHETSVTRALLIDQMASESNPVNPAQSISKVAETSDRALTPHSAKLLFRATIVTSSL